MNPDPEIQLDVQMATGNTGLPDTAAMATWVRAALLAAGRPVGEQPIELTIRMVDEAESQELNNSYRGKPYPTNVLSFAAGLPPGLPMDLLGDLVICAPVVAREAGEQGKAPSAHWAHMVVHGTLHLLGYDHTDDSDAELMESLEIAILAGLEFTNPYADMEGSTQSHG